MGVFEPVSLIVKMVQMNVFDLSKDSDVTCLLLCGLVIHSVNACLASILAADLSSSSSLNNGNKRIPQYCSAVAALIFAVHPVFVEVVVWISAQPYLLATMFSLCALLCQIRRLSTLSAVFVALAIMSKVAAVSIIPFSILLELHLRVFRKDIPRESTWKFSLAQGLNIIVALFFIFKTKQYHGVADVLLARVVCDDEQLYMCSHEDVTLRSPGCDVQWRDHPVSHCMLWPSLNMKERILRALHAVGIYVFQLIILVLPWSSQGATSWILDHEGEVESLPCMRHPIPHRDFLEQDNPFFTPCTILGFMILAIAGFEFFICRGIKFVSFLILVLPTLGLMGNHKGEMASDRYIYLVSFCAGVWMLSDLFQRLIAMTTTTAAIRNTVLTTLVVCCVAVSSSRSHSYASNWNTSRDMWEYAATKCATKDSTSYSSFARESVTSLDSFRDFSKRWHKELRGQDLLLGLADTSLEDRAVVSEASELFSHAVKLHPMKLLAHEGLAMTLIALGRYQDALEHLDMSCVLKPTKDVNANRLGHVLGAMNQFQDAANVWERIIKYKPNVPEHRINAGVALARVGKYAESVKMLESALKISDISDESRKSAKQALSEVMQLLLLR